MQNDHFQGCNCYECYDGGNHVDSPVGKFIRSDKTVKMYLKAGGKLARTIKPQSYIGKVKSLNTKKNWLITNENLWVPWSKDLQFKEAGTAKELTLDEKVDIASGIAAGIGGPPKQVSKVLYDTGKGVVEITEGVLDTVAFLGRNLKLILIVVIIAAIAFSYNKLKS